MACHDRLRLCKTEKNTQLGLSKSLQIVSLLLSKLRFHNKLALIGPLKLFRRL